MKPFVFGFVFGAATLASLTGLLGSVQRIRLIKAQVAGIRAQIIDTERRSK